MQIEGKKTVTLLTEKQISQRLQELAKEVADHYLNQGIESIILTIVLHGGLVLGAQFLQMLADEGLEAKLDTVQISSYGLNTSTSRDPKVVKKPSLNWDNEHILVFEDLIDSGWSMDVLFRTINGENENLASLALFAFLVKEGVSEVEVPVDFSAFTLHGDEKVDKGKVWIDGAGIDTSEKNRGKRTLDAQIDIDKDVEVTVVDNHINLKYLQEEVA